MNDYNNGEIWGWNGGDRPVHPESEINVWLRGESGSFDRLAGHLWWGHRGNDGDIVCFQVTKVHVEPKVLWVNEYPAGAYLGYPSEELAKAFASEAAVRIGVKYTEEQK